MQRKPNNKVDETSYNYTQCVEYICTPTLNTPLN